MLLHATCTTCNLIPSFIVLRSIKFYVHYEQQLPVTYVHQ